MKNNLVEKMAVNMDTVLILSFCLFFCIRGLDVCEDKSNDCQPCSVSYPVPLPTRENCMKTCLVCTIVNNVALNQITRQSSFGYKSGESYKAVDGNTNGNLIEGKSCTHTKDTGTHWWCVDLKKIYNIKNLTVYNRVDFNSERLEGFELNTSSSGQCNEAGFTTSSPCYKNDPPTDQRVYTIDRCNQDSNKSIVAGTLFVSVTGVALTICEFQVFTGIACSYGYYSTSSSTCEPCDGCSDNKCNPGTGDCIGVCKSGFYGTKCQQNCSEGCENKECTKSEGSCSCINGWFGPRCQLQCNTGCKGNVCDQNDGKCRKGCNIGYHGDQCNKDCSKGCLNLVCRQNDGNCSEGCNQGLYGDQCNKDCSQGCSTPDCKRDGSCTVCKPGLYGDNCESRCPTGCKETCNKTSGTCDECKEETVGLYCNIKCGEECRTMTEEEKRWSICKEEDCNKSCISKCNGSSCEPSTEECTYKCIGGKETDVCLIEIGKEVAGTPESSLVVATAATVSVVLLLVVAIIIVVIFVLRRRNRRKSRADEDEGANPTVVFGGGNSMTETTTKEQTEAKGSVYENVATQEDNCCYQNDNVEARSATRINLTDLVDYINQHKAGNSFQGEFQALPSGLCAAYDYGLNQANKLKNRYKNMCAYDHSRVKLDVENDDPYSDYINACYITGFGNVERKYIASQGPVANMIVEFWRMVWLVDSGKIVMLTNLQEIGMQKCLQYWPNEGKLKKFGNISIKLVEESVFSHFTIRKLKVEREGWDPRYVEQFHYTAWPDKSIPRDIPSLLEFTYKVNQTPSSLTGPLVVHCSAGIGRTGTFIGLDYLIEEGKKMESVDVLKCVEQMRYERVNMVQTMSQYVLLHEALLEAFASGDAIAVASYKEQIQKMLAGKENAIREMFKKLESVRLPVTNERCKAALLEENKPKNRDMSVLPLDDFRIFLPYCGENSSDYINAVRLPSYKKKYGYIITQTPLQETVADFWKMLVEAEVEIVVNMDSTESHDNVGDYVPENGQLVVGNFTVTKLDEKLNDNGFYSVLTLSVEDKNNVDSKKVTTFYQCRFWESGNTTPTEVSPILALLDDVQSTSSHTDNNGPPIAVMCLNGATKSGLFCVLAAVIERLNIEQRVNVLLTILQLRLYRPQIITSPGQLQFCIDAVNEYVEKYSTYVNSV